MEVLVNLWKKHCLKSVRISGYSGPYFSPFGLNTERYKVSLHIQSECEKMETRITPKMDTFHHRKHGVISWYSTTIITINSKNNFQRSTGYDWVFQCIWPIISPEVDEKLQWPKQVLYPLFVYDSTHSYAHALLTQAMSESDREEQILVVVWGWRFC